MRMSIVFSLTVIFFCIGMVVVMLLNGIDHAYEQGRQAGVQTRTAK